MDQPTLTDVANRAGVSRQSAGAILAGKSDLFRAETVQVVRKAALALGYRPNGAGQALRNGSTGFIGMIQDRYRYRSILSADLIEAIEDQLAKTDRQLVYAALAEDSDPPQLISRIVADGLLINYNADIPPALERATAGGRTPAVYLNIRRRSACVYHEERAGAAMLTSHCIQRWGSAAWLDQSPANPADRKTEPHHSIADRRDGYEQACAEAGRPPRLLRSTYGSGSAALVEQYQELLARPDRPRCIIIGDDFETALVAFIAAARLGIQVPDDLALAGYGSWRRVQLGWAMPVLVQRWDSLGRTAVDLVLASIARPQERIPAIAIPLDLQG
ncbi:MAG: LacI family DNA-binding transcriptional regulator [Planctomycetes bacterium]|nr:LacI family DNA-binding transcriptional regulator [Planctomycetota bacterium]